MNKKIGMTALATLMTFSAAVAPSAATAETSVSEMNPWAHCGIGAMIFSRNEVGAIISNIIWDLGTTAFTSATASPDSCASELVNVAMFIDASYEQLAMETAQGAGEHLNAALAMVGCTDNANVANELRTQLTHVVASADYAEMAHEDKAYSYFSGLRQAAVQCGTVL